jgi:uncharacterized protein YggE
MGRVMDMVGGDITSANKQYYAVTVISIVSLALLNAVAIYYGFSRPMNVATSGKEETQSNIISVSGTGSAYALPDVAYVSVTVVTQSATAAEAQQKNAVTMNNVIDALRSIGVMKEEMTTEQYSLRPVYDYDKQQRIVGYECRNSLRVTWKKIYEVGTVLDAAVRAGANNVGSVTFGLSKQKVDSLTAEAIKEAVADADAKAQALASSLKLTIVGKISASIGTSYVPRSTGYELKADTAPILPAELSVTVTVNVNYRFS